MPRHPSLPNLQTLVELPDPYSSTSDIRLHLCYFTETTLIELPEPLALLPKDCFGGAQNRRAVFVQTRDSAAAGNAQGPPGI